LSLRWLAWIFFDLSDLLLIDLYGRFTCPERGDFTSFFGGNEVTRRSSSTGTFGPSPINLLKKPCFDGLPIGTDGLGAASDIVFPDDIVNEPLLPLVLYPTPVVGT